MPHRLFYFIAASLFLAACGSLAEENATFEPTNTALSRAANVESSPDSEQATDISPSETPPPTATDQPTATSLPPTATLTATSEPTETITPEVTEEVVSQIEGNPANGEVLFNEFGNPESGLTCSICHNTNNPIPGAGPYLYGIANDAAERVAGQDAADYLLTAILDPSDFIAPPQLREDESEAVFVDGVMPQNWGTVLDEQQLADLVAYLLTLDQVE